MAALSISQFLTLYTWFLLVFLLVFLLLIARFYQKFSSERTFFGLFTVPILLFGAAMMRYASINQLAGDTAADGLLALAGVVLSVLCLFLYHMMTRNR